MSWSPAAFANLLRAWANDPSARRWAAGDLVDALRPDRPPPEVAERRDEIPWAVTPFEQLEAATERRGLELFDYRDLEVWPRDREYDWREWGWPPDKSRGLPYGTRDWNHLTAIWLHTYDASVGPKRFLGVPAHLGVSSLGRPILIHHLWRLLAHGHRANRFSAGMEISGLSDFDSQAQIQTCRDLVRYVVDVRTLNLDPAGPYTGPMVIGAHRQSHRSRVRDPGRRIWREVGEWAIEELGLGVGPVVGSGRELGDWRPT